MPVMDLTSVIESFATGTYTVTRPGPAVYGSDGRLDTPSSTTFTARGCVQPVTGRELKRLPEAFKTEEVISFWTPTELRTENTSAAADLMSYEGETWQVQKVESWSTLGAYWRVYLMKVSQL